MLQAAQPTAYKQCSEAEGYCASHQNTKQLTSEIARHRTVNRHRLGHDGFLDRSEARRLRYTDVVDQAVFLFRLLKVGHDGFLKLGKRSATGSFLCGSNTVTRHLAGNTTFILDSLRCSASTLLAGKVARFLESKYGEFFVTCDHRLMRRKSTKYTSVRLMLSLLR